MSWIRTVRTKEETNDKTAHVDSSGEMNRLAETVLPASIHQVLLWNNTYRKLLIQSALATDTYRTSKRELSTLENRQEKGKEKMYKLYLLGIFIRVFWSNSGPNLTYYKLDFLMICHFSDIIIIFFKSVPSRASKPNTPSRKLWLCFAYETPHVLQVWYRRAAYI